MPGDSVSDFTLESCQVARTLSCLAIERLFSSTVAFGTATNASSFDGQKVADPFGARKSAAIASGTAQMRGLFGRVGGAFSRYGSVRFGEMEGWDRRKLSN